MAVTYNQASITDFSTGFPLNAAEWNAPQLETENIFNNGNTDFFIRHQVFQGTSGEALTAGDAVRIGPSGTILRCDNTSAAGITGFIGFSLKTVAVSTSVIVSTNSLYGTSGLTAGETYYIGTSGTITETRPNSTGFVLAIGKAISSTVLQLNRQDYIEETPISYTDSTTGFAGIGLSEASSGTNKEPEFKFHIGQRSIAGLGTSIDADRECRIQNDNTTNANAVIGYSLADYDAGNNRRCALFLDSQNGVFGLEAGSSTGNEPNFILRFGGSTKLSIDENTGNILPGSDGVQDIGSGSFRFKDVWATNGTIQTSCLTTKKDIDNSELGLDFIDSLRPVSYKFKDDKENQIHFGLIAQEVESSFIKNGYNPKDLSVINYDEESGLYGLRYTELIAIMIKSIKELKEMINND